MAQKHLLDIAKALALYPRILILHEPTAALDQDATVMLFTRIRRVVAGGTAVIYITRRLAEVHQIAHRVTVLRDGRAEGRGMVAEVSDNALNASRLRHPSTSPPRACPRARSATWPFPSGAARSSVS